MVVRIVFSDAAGFEDEVCAVTRVTVRGLCVCGQSLDKWSSVGFGRG
jgi:hypothetical protein